MKIIYEELNVIRAVMDHVQESILNHIVGKIDKVEVLSTKPVSICIHVLGPKEAEERESKKK